MAVGDLLIYQGTDGNAHFGRETGDGLNQGQKNLQVVNGGATYTNVPQDTTSPYANGTWRPITSNQNFTGAIDGNAHFS